MENFGAPPVKGLTLQNDPAIDFPCKMDEYADIAQ